MTFSEIVEAAKKLPIEQQRQLQRELNLERVRRLEAAFDKLREGLTEEQIAEMTAAMNEEYIEPDDADWATE